MKIIFPILLSFLIGLSAVAAQQPDLLPCTERPTTLVGRLFVDNNRWCVESIVNEPDIEPMSFSALEVAPDGSLYATRPLSGQVMVIRDTDGDFFPDKMESLVDGLTLPNGLAYHDDSLYISGGANIYRFTEGNLEIIVDDLPSGTGFWTGGIVIGEDERLYVAMGAPCDYCEFDNPERGAILSMNLDGTDRQTIASGFRNPADVEFFNGELWTLDSTGQRFQQKTASANDELNQVQAGGFYGFPYCAGDTMLDFPSDEIDCATAIASSFLFGQGATPTSLAAYPYDTLPGTQNSLIVVLSGEPTQVNFTGFMVVMVHFTSDNQAYGGSLLIPYRPDSGRWAYQAYTPDEAFVAPHIITLSTKGWGFYPDQPLAVAVNSRGWIYISLTGGEIIALRPVDELPSNYDSLYPSDWAMSRDFQVPQSG